MNPVAVCICCRRVYASESFCCITEHGLVHLRCVGCEQHGLIPQHLAAASGILLFEKDEPMTEPTPAPELQTAGYWMERLQRGQPMQSGEAISVPAYMEGFRHYVLDLIATTGAQNVPVRHAATHNGKVVPEPILPPARRRQVDIWREIVMERDRQEHLVEEGKFAWTCASKNVSNLEKLPVFMEEVGEVCTELLPDGRVMNLRTELIQTAAVCVAWLESLDPSG